MDRTGGWAEGAELVGRFVAKRRKRRRREQCESKIGWSRVVACFCTLSLSLSLSL